MIMKHKSREGDCIGWYGSAAGRLAGRLASSRGGFKGLYVAGRLADWQSKLHKAFVDLSVLPRWLCWKAVSVFDDKQGPFPCNSTSNLAWRLVSSRLLYLVSVSNKDPIDVGSALALLLLLLLLCSALLCSSSLHLLSVVIIGLPIISPRICRDATFHCQDVDDK